MKCPNCGQNLPDDVRFCNICGRLVHQKELNYSVKHNHQQTCKQKIKLKPEKLQKNISKSHSIHGIPVVFALFMICCIFVLCGMLLSEEKIGTSEILSTMEQSQENKQSELGQERLESAESQTEIVQPIIPKDPDAEKETVVTTEKWGYQEIYITPKGNGLADLILRQEYQGTWKTLFECEAAIGRNGTTHNPSEGDGKTPVGTFPVLFCYGLEQPQTGIDFIELTPDSVWVDDSESEYYNCLTTRQEAGSVSFEETYSQFKRGYYSCNIFFANNGDGQTPGSATPGKGSVRVLEGYQKSLEPTNGDIKISGQDMDTLLGLLDAKYNPVVIVVG